MSFPANRSKRASSLRVGTWSSIYLSTWITVLHPQVVVLDRAHEYA